MLAGAARRVPGRRARDRRRREPRGARRVRARRARSGRRSASATAIEHAQLLAPEDLPRFAELGVACSVQFSHAPSDRDLADRFWAGKIGGRLRLPLAASTRAPSSRTARTRRSRSSTRSPGSAPACAGRSTSAPPWHPEQALTVEQAFEATTRRAGLALRRRAPAREAAPGLRRRPRRPRPRSRGTTSTRRSSRRWSPAAGCTTRRPGTESRRLRARRARGRARGRGDPERHVLGEQPLVRRVDVRVGQAEAGDDRRDPLVRERRHDRQRPAGADQRRPDAERPLERVEPELDRLRVRRHEPGRRRGPAARSRARARPARPRAAAARARRAISSTCWPGREPDREVRDRLDRQHRLLQVRRAALEAVDVERRLGERAQVELLGGARVGRPRALLGELVGARRAAPRQPASSSSVGGTMPLPQRLGEAAVAGDEPRDHRRERVGGVERSAAVDPGVQIALAGAHA